MAVTVITRLVLRVSPLFVGFCIIVRFFRFSRIVINAGNVCCLIFIVSSISTFVLVFARHLSI